MKSFLFLSISERTSLHFRYDETLVFCMHAWTTLARKENPSALPEVRGTADVDGGAYLPFLPLPRTPSRLSSFRSTDGRTGTDRTCGRTRCCLRTILHAVCGDRGGLRRGPRTTTSFGPQRELPPARLVIHRQTSAQNIVGDAGKFRRGRAY